VELSSQDILQMLGRAGRPQYDTFGEGITTNHSEMQYYASLLNQQLPIKSQFVLKLADNLDVFNGLPVRVSSFSPLLPNLTLVCSYIRILRSPALYSVGVDYQEEDGALVQKRADIAHSTAVLLEKCQLIKYERSSGRFQSTELGWIASYYYLTYNSMMAYNQHLCLMMSTVESFRVFALSNEFKFVPVSFLP